MKRRSHYILFFSTLALAVFGVILFFHINVNNDMSKYLPDDSQMKIGKDSLEAEFGPIAQFSGSNVHVMFEGLRPNEVPGIKTLLSGYPDVQGVSYRYSADSAATLFDLDVPDNVNQKALGKQISNRFGGNCVVETSQDGATPPLSVMIISAVMIMLVLIVMAQSWLEPFVILITAGIAIILNVGTNAFLPSVSVTTNFIGPILQAVLSLDYCIVLLNRYRQEQIDPMDRDSAVLAANKAIKRAMPSILSSAFTTIVGLLMLCFMRLKIGADMGIVLAKGVVFSLICTFTVMPSLMMLFRRAINKTAKPAYVPPTERFARFVARHKLPMATGAVALFIAAWFIAQKTTIFFSEKAESEIEEVFPSPNPFVILYHTEDENHVFDMANELMAQPHVQAVISYPTLMSQPLTPSEMATHVHSLLTDYKEMMPEGTNVPPEMISMINPEMVQIVYYMRSKDSSEYKMTFPDLARFLHSHVATNPLFSSYLDDEMMEQIDLLQTMLDMPAPVEEKPVEEKPVENQKSKISNQKSEIEDTIALPRETIAPLTANPAPLAVIEDTLAVPHMELNKIAVVPFFEKLRAAEPSATALEMHKLTDTVAIRLPLSVSEMSLFMGSTQFQTKFVYGYAPKGKKKLTPLEYVHLLRDDLFKRAGLAGMVSDEQKRLLSQRAHLMDLADENASLTPADLNILLRAFGIDDLTDEDLLAIANPPVKEEPKVVASPAEINKDAIVSSMAEVQRSLHSTDTTRAVMPEKKVNKPVVHKPTKADLQAALFTELVFGGKAYTAEEMAVKLERLMKLSDVKADPVTPDQLSLLYDYYGSVNSRCDTLRAGFEELLTYLCDTLVFDARLDAVLPPQVRAGAVNAKVQMQEGLGQLRGERFSLFVVLSPLPAESEETYALVDKLFAAADTYLPSEHYLIGRSVMYHEMKSGFGAETRKVSLLTILTIFLIVALTFRSIIVPTILVVAVMTAVYVNVVVAGVVSGQMLYLAFLIVQAILMGASIDYGILFANYYRESRKKMMPVDAVCAAYAGSIRTILTSGLIMILGAGGMALFVDDLMISNIVGSIAVGAFIAVILTLTVVPAVLVALDRWVVYGKKNRFTEE